MGCDSALVMTCGMHGGDKEAMGVSNFGEVSRTFGVGKTDDGWDAVAGEAG